MRDICAELNEIDGDKIAGTYLAGSDLAIALLEEGSSRHQPRFENLLARVAIMALDTGNSDLQIQLADVYEPQLQTIYQDAIDLRLTSSNIVQFIGAWNCLLRLVAADIPWAVQLATQKWPAQQGDRVRILRSVAEPTKNTWATDKLLELIPSTPVTTFTDVLESEYRRHWLEGRILEPELETAISVIQSRMSHSGIVNVLNTGISYGPIVRVNANENVILPRLRHMQGWHPSWDVYKYAGDFMEAPSKKSLADALESLASFFYTEEDMPPTDLLGILPWPILACLNICTNSQELLQLADKANQGALGDVDDWIAAETRWFDKGITRDDLLSISDDRLPFDAKIGETGFPTTISMLAALIGSPRDRASMGDVLDIFSNLSPGKTRSFVARTINLLFLVHSLTDPSDQESTVPDIDYQTLESVYREIPPDSFIPILMIVNLIGDSIQRVAEFFRSFKDKKFVFHSAAASRNHGRESVTMLRRAYMGLDEDALLLPILGLLAENGHLEGQYVDIKHPHSLETVEEELAALIINLHQEKWQIDSSEQLISSAQEMGKSSGDVFNRIVTTLEISRQTGENVDKFVVALRRLIPSDDLSAYKRYVNLLEDVLRRRTSQFAVPKEAPRFALPEGIVELLRN